MSGYEVAIGHDSIMSCPTPEIAQVLSDSDPILCAGRVGG